MSKHGLRARRMETIQGECSGSMLFQVLGFFSPVTHLLRSGNLHCVVKCQKSFRTSWFKYCEKFSCVTPHPYGEDRKCSFVLGPRHAHNNNRFVRIQVGQWHEEDEFHIHRSNLGLVGCRGTATCVRPALETCRTSR